MKTLKIAIAILPLLFLTRQLYAAAQEEVSQGQPGTKGPWPVKLSGSNVTDAGFIIVTEPMLTALPQTTVQVGLTAVAVPTTSAANRTCVEICNTSANQAGVIIKCIINNNDAGVPVLGPSTPGTTLVVGQCLQVKAPATMLPFCISNTAAIDGGGGAFAAVAECIQ